MNLARTFKITPPISSNAARIQHTRFRFEQLNKCLMDAQQFHVMNATIIAIFSPPFQEI